MGLDGILLTRQVDCLSVFAMKFFLLSFLLEVFVCVCVCYEVISNLELGGLRQ